MSKKIEPCLVKKNQSKNQVIARWFVYMVRTHCNTLYTGITTDVGRRFSEHLACFNGVSKKGAKYFRGRKPKEVVYTESCENRSIASKRECEIKKMTKEAKNKLIGKYK
jgi:putative endonuclease